MSKVLRGIELTDAPADLAPVGETRIRRIGGVLMQSTDGGAYAALGGGTSSTAALLSAVRVVAVSNITLSGTQTIDGVAVQAGDRVLVSGQSTASQNGVYVVAAGAWARSTDFSTAGQMVTGTLVPVYQGTTYAGSVWQFTTSTAITVGTTSLSFVDVPGAGALAGQTLAQARLTLRPEYFIQNGGASAQTLALAGLAGNTDGGYDIEGLILVGHSGASYTIAFPGWAASSLYAATFTDVVGQLSTPAASSIPLMDGGVGAGITALSIIGTVRTLPSLGRRLFDLRLFADSTTMSITFVDGWSTDVTNSLTGITLGSNFSDAIANGSWLRATALGLS